eukprot:10890144-Ditylum_brightwellii.AAC.1
MDEEVRLMLKEGRGKWNETKNKGKNRCGFCSLLQHGFLIGGQSKKNLEAVVSAKECDFCASAKWGKRKAKKYQCPKNYEGSSKVMEADAALVLTTKVYEEHGLVIEKNVADDNSSMKAV